jgi:hypothetical protein
VVAFGVALALTVSVPRAVGRPLAQGSTPRPARSIADTGGLRLPLPRRWHGVAVYGGIGSNPFGVGELVVANFHISRAAVECEHVLPQLTPRQVLLRVYDYGPGMEAGSWRPGGLRLGRVRFHGRFVVVDGVFGARKAPPAILRRVDRLLHGASAA